MRELAYLFPDPDGYSFVEEQVLSVVTNSPMFITLSPSSFLVEEKFLTYLLV